MEFGHDQGVSLPAGNESFVESWAGPRGAGKSMVEVHVIVCDAEGVEAVAVSSCSLVETRA